MAHWVTPPVIMDDGKITSLGEVNYGTESRMFLFAFSDTNTDQRVIDTSIPAYHNIIDMTAAEKGLFTDPKYIIINPSQTPLNNTEEVPLTYVKNGVTLDTGLCLASNGQIVGRLQVTTPLSELVFKIKYIDPPGYEQGIKYRAYSHVHSNGQLYRLNPDATTPYYAESGTPSIDDWTPVGEYVPQFSPVAPYVNGSEYKINDKATHNGRLYKLLPVVATQLKAITATPDLTYWNNLGVIAGAFAVYKQGTIYTIGARVKVGTTVYELRQTQPYISSTPTPDLSFWTDMGVYDNKNDETTERIFKIIINTRRSSLITFTSPQNLGIVKIGQQLGDSVIKDIRATSDGSISYELLPANRSHIGVDPVKDASGIYRILPKGLTLNSDGLIVGCPIGPVGTYTFDVIARNTFALEKQQTFSIDVYAGYLPNTRSAILKPRFDIERSWYKMITDSAMTDVKLYRPSDSNYGLCDYPKVMLKRNLKCEYLNTFLSSTMTQSLVASRLQTFEAIACRLGNMRYQVALDEQGEPLYEILYKEIIPSSATVVYDPDPLNIKVIGIPEIVELKDILTTLLGSDDALLMNDPLRALATNKVQLTYDDAMLWSTNHNNKNIPFGYSVIVPVAYVLPGESEKFIARAIEYSTLPHMMVNYPLLLDTLVISSIVYDGTQSSVVPLPIK